MTKHRKNREKCLKYFELFCNKDLIGLENIFSDEIILRDWEVYKQGKISVLQANESIFSLVGSISINPIHIYSDDETVISELEIVINNVDRIFAVDLISFNKIGKITNIHAYKR